MCINAMEIRIKCTAGESTEWIMVAKRRAYRFLSPQNRGISIQKKPNDGQYAVVQCRRTRRILLWILRQHHKSPEQNMRHMGWVYRDGTGQAANLCQGGELQAGRMCGLCVSI